MSPLIRMFHEAGWGAYLTLLLGVFLATPLAMIGLGLGLARHRHHVILCGLALGLAALTVVAGYGFEQLGMRNVEEAILNVNPADKEMIRAQGKLEASTNVTLALGFAGLPILLGALGLALGGRKNTA